ncbi:hypothetical protein FQN50_006981 [Emmonsiellopsis sp. PD_5]|nr:hypothetical protein FQN50_006981 [Emmonsiellopsis sp. PD_5]
MNSTYIPANASDLVVRYNLQNGSLHQQLIPYFSPYPGNELDQNITLNLLDNNLASLIFKPSLSDRMEDTISLTLPLADNLLGGSSFRIPVNCIYPLSGQYGYLPRLLYYLLLVFSLLFRRHTWLSTAALGTAMTYAATAAIHLFILTSKFQFGMPPPRKPEYGNFIKDLWANWDSNSSVAYGDVDVFGIYPILTTAGIMLTPILKWSSTIRKHRAQAIVVYWGILIFAALVPTLLLTSFSEWEVNSPPSLVLCQNNSDPTCNPKQELTFEFYQRCQCIDFCSTLNPAAPLRSASNMVAWLQKGVAVKSFEQEEFWNLFGINILVLIFIVVMGAIGLVESQSSQAGVRNIIFKILNSDRSWWIKLLYEGEKEDLLLKSNTSRSNSTPSSPKLSTRIRLHVAKYVAASFTLLSILVVVIVPAVFITNIVVNELYIRGFPESEQKDAVGSWGAWVGAALVLWGAVIDRYHNTWIVSIKLLWSTIWRHKRYTKAEQRRSVQPASHNMAQKETGRFFQEISSPFTHTLYSTKRMFRTAKFNLEEFKEWWANPKEKSREFAPEIKARLKATLRGIQCPCAWCKYERNEQIKAKRELEWRQREINSDSDDDDEFAGERAYWRERIQMDVGEDYEITRMEDGQEPPDWVKPTDKLARMQYVYLAKRVKRYLGRNYKIVNADFLNNNSALPPSTPQSLPPSMSAASGATGGLQQIPLGIINTGPPTSTSPTQLNPPTTATTPPPPQSPPSTSPTQPNHPTTATASAPSPPHSPPSVTPTSTIAAPPPSASRTSSVSSLHVQGAGTNNPATPP